MNDEIKEILEELQNMYEISELEEQVNNINKIKDYITNLQQENERLKEANKVLEENWEHYMMRCSKALDYVNNTSNFRLITLQNILQNGSDEE